MDTSTRAPVPNQAAGLVGLSDEEEYDEDRLERERDQQEKDELAAAEAKLKKLRPRITPDLLFHKTHLCTDFLLPGVGCKKGAACLLAHGSDELEYHESDRGCKKLLAVFPTLDFAGTKGNEAKDMRKLVQHYKEWAFNLMPTQRFELIVQRLEKMGAQKRIKGEVEALRARVTGRGQTGGVGNTDWSDDEQDTGAAGGGFETYDANDFDAIVAAAAAAAASKSSTSSSAAAAPAVAAKKPVHVDESEFVGDGHEAERAFEEEMAGMDDMDELMDDEDDDDEPDFGPDPRLLAALDAEEDGEEHDTQPTSPMTSVLPTKTSPASSSLAPSRSSTSSSAAAVATGDKENAPLDNGSGTDSSISSSSSSSNSSSSNNNSSSNSSHESGKVARARPEEDADANVDVAAASSSPTKRRRTAPLSLEEEI